MNNKIYLEDMENTKKMIANVEKLKDKTIFLAGATGLIGSFIVDFILYLNNKKNYNVKIIANSRKGKSLEKRFSYAMGNKNLEFYVGDINENIEYESKIDFIINCASNTHPVQYSTDPIGTIITNINGTNNLLKLAETKKAKMIFLSSVEIYGDNVNNIGKFKENQMGYIDCNTLRAGYNEAKRAGEALCQAYKEQKGIDFSIVRLPRIYGPTIKESDSKVISQFINKALNKEDIILKSEGKQYFSYLYVADAVSGILQVMLNGKNGDAYNLGNTESDIHLNELAKTIANLSNTKVIFDVPNTTEKKGFSTATDARLDYTKISNELGWKPFYTIKDGIQRTLSILNSKSC